VDITTNVSTQRRVLTERKQDRRIEESGVVGIKETQKNSTKVAKKKIENRRIGNAHDSGGILGFGKGAGKKLWNL